MKKVAIITAFFVTTASTPALARDGAGYVSIGGGITAVDDSEFSSVADPDFDDISVEWGTGFDITGAVGYDFGRFRTEAEVSYKSVGYDRVLDGSTVVFENDDNVKFDFSTWSVMANALLDIGPDDSFNGFIGGGIGIAGTELDARDRDGGVDDALQDSDTGFAWQLLAGVRVPVSTSVDAGLKYRYFNQSGLGFVVSDEDDFNTDLSSHSVLATLTFNFGG